MLLQEQDPHPLDKRGYQSLQSGSATPRGLCLQGQVASSNHCLCCLQDIGILGPRPVVREILCQSLLSGTQSSKDRTLSNVRTADTCPRLQESARIPMQSCHAQCPLLHSEFMVACCGDAQKRV